MTGSTAARQPRPIRPEPIRRISLADLDLDQIEAAELLVGLSAKRWDEAPSQAKVFKAVYSVAYGVTMEEAGKMTLRQLQERVDISSDGDPDQSGPTPPSA